MASINGLSVKHLKKFPGHEEEDCYQGELYLGKTKIGFWSQDSWGCVVDNFNAEPGISEKKLYEEIKAMNGEKTIHGVSKSGKPYTIDYELTQLMYDYLGLLEDEKLFKKAVKKGYSSVFIITDGYKVCTISLSKDYDNASDELLKRIFAKEIAEAEKGKTFKDATITTKVYRSLNDFKIGEPIKLESIRKEEA